MSRPWTITLEYKLESVAVLRCEPGLELGSQQDQLWLKSDGHVMIDSLLVKQLPATARYYIDDEKRLFRLGEITPSGSLPDLKWEPIAEAIPIGKPVAAMPADVKTRFPIQLMRASQEREPKALLLPFASLAAWVEDAPAFRMEKLRFAVSERGETLVLGSPLPPLPGQAFWRERSLLFPAGYALQIPEMAVLIEQKIRTEYPDSHVLMFHVDANWEVLENADFQPLSRSAVRNTGKEVGDG